MGFLAPRESDGQGQYVVSSLVREDLRTPRSASIIASMGLFNLLWFVFIGSWSAVLWLMAAGVFALTIVGIPLAKAFLQFAKLSAFPFGKEVIRETELKGAENVSPVRRIGGIIVNTLWIPFGLIATSTYFVLGVICFATIVGIPVGIVLVRMGSFVLFPIGAKVVTKKQAYAAAVANQIRNRE